MKDRFEIAIENGMIQIGMWLIACWDNLVAGICAVWPVKHQEEPLEIAFPIGEDATLYPSVPRLRADAFSDDFRTMAEALTLIGSAGKVSIHRKNAFVFDEQPEAHYEEMLIDYPVFEDPKE